MLITGNFLVFDNKEGICVFDALAISIWSCSYALIEAYHTVSELLITNFGVFRVVSHLAVLYELAGVFIKDGHGSERY